MAQTNPPPAARTSSAVSSLISREEDLYPYNESDGIQTNNTISTSSLQTQQALQSLTVLTDEVKALAKADGEKIHGSSELIIRSDEILLLLQTHSQLFHTHLSHHLISEAFLALKKALYSTKIILRKASEVTFRRNAKFKIPLRICMNDLVLSLSRLGNAMNIVSNGHVLNEDDEKHPTSLPSIKAGQLECLDGDKYYFGHGVAVDHKRALECYKKACDLKYLPAFTHYATMKREGKGCIRDMDEAVDYFKRGAALLNLDCLTALGQLYETGEGVKKNLETAIDYYQQAANAGHAEAMCNLGYIYEHGSEDEVNFVPADVDAAQAWYGEAAEKGNSRAQNNLGYLFFAANPPDYARAVKYFSLSAESGNASAQNNLGICYESGKGVVRNEEIAMKWYLSAAKQGHPSALSSLGYLYLKQKQFESALECFNRATLSGEKEAFYHLGQIYKNGLNTNGALSGSLASIEKNDKLAFSYFSKAAAQNHAFALLEVGHYYFAGGGGLKEKNTQKAFEFYKLAANQQLAEAENCLGVMLEEGVGTIKDISQAIYFYERAASKGHADAIFNMGLLLEQGKGVEKNVKLAWNKIKEAAQLGSMQAHVKLAQEKVRQTQQTNNNMQQSSAM